MVTKKDLERALYLKAYIEGKYLYTQGMIDSSGIAKFLESEIIDNDFLAGFDDTDF